MPATKNAKRNEEKRKQLSARMFVRKQKTMQTKWKNAWN